MTLEEAKGISRRLVDELGGDFGPAARGNHAFNEFDVGQWNAHALLRRFRGQTFEEVRDEYLGRES